MRDDDDILSYPSDTSSSERSEWCRTPYERLIALSTDIVCVIDRERRILELHASSDLILGFAPARFIGGPLSAFVVESDRVALENAVAGIVDGGPSVDKVFASRHCDGTLRSMRWTMYWDKGIAHAYCCARDVTAYDRIVDDLKTTVARFEFVTKATSDVVWEWDVERRQMYRGEGTERLFGRDTEHNEPDHSLWIRHIHPDDRSRVEFGVERAIADGSTFWEEEYRFVRPDGTIAVVHDRAVVVRNEAGEALRVVGAMHDITQRTDEHQRLLLLESVITTTNDAVLITEAHPLDEPGPAIIYVNEAFTRMTGYELSDVIGRSPRLLQGPRSDLAALDRLGQAMRRNESCEIETINYKKSGEEFWINFSVSPVTDAQGKVTHFISIERDVTEKKQFDLKRALLADIAMIFNRSLPLDTTLNEALQRLSEFGGFDLAEAWLVGIDGERIALRGYSTPSDALKAMYTNLAGSLSVGPGHGLPGVTWSTGEVQTWSVDDATVDIGRREAFRSAGLTTLYGLPLRHHGSTIGVLILGTKNWSDATSTLKRILTGFEAQFCAEILRKRLEEELNQLFALAPDIICILGVDGRYRQVNPAMSAILGYSEAELLERSAVDFVHPDDRELTRSKLGSFRNGEQNHYFENRHVTKSNDVIWLAWTVSPATEDGHVFAVAKDITEKKRLEQLYEETARMAKVGSWELNLRDGTLWWSPITRSIHEVDDTFDLHYESAQSFFLEDDQPRIVDAFEQCILHGTPFDVELRIQTGVGNIRWVRAIGACEFVDGVCQKVIGSFQDIDERRRAEEEVVQTLREKTTVLESIGDGFITLDKNWIITYWNAAAARMLGVQSDAMLGQNVWEAYEDAVGSTFYTEYHRAVADNVAVHFEEYYPPVNKWFAVDAYPSTAGLAIYLRDVTEQRQSEERLRQSNERFERVAQATNDAIWDLDLLTENMFWGDGMRVVFGHHYPDGVTTMTTSMANIHPDEVDAVKASIQATLANPTIDRWQHEYRFRRHDGSWAYVADVGSVIRDPNGRAVRMVGALQDITYRRQYEESLKVLNDGLQQSLTELERSNAELEQFAYVASHDLQEPLRMVTSFLTLLERKYGGQLDENAHTYIHYATDGAKRMRQIILDLLEYSRAGRSDTDLEEIDVDTILLEVTALFERRIEESNARVTWGTMPTIRGRAVPIRQVFQNLIGNALTYHTPESTPRVEITCQEEPTQWCFSIADNGIGISSEYFDRVFQIFQRLNTQEQFAGTGMGLSICKKVIDSIGGSIWVESIEGKGSTFFFTIPKVVA